MAQITGGIGSTLPQSLVTGDPGVLYNEVIRRLGRNISLPEYNDLLTQHGYQGQGPIGFNIGQSILSSIANPELQAFQPIRPMPPPMPVIPTPAPVTPPVEPVPEPEPEPELPPNLDPNSIHNEIQAIVGRPLTPGEISYIAQAIGLQSGQPITVQNRIDALALAVHFRDRTGPFAQTPTQTPTEVPTAPLIAQPNLDPNAIHNEIIALLGRQLTPAEIQHLSQTIGLQSGQPITAQNREDVLTQVQQFMQGLPVTPTGMNPNLAAPAAQRDYSQPVQAVPRSQFSQPSAGRFNFGADSQAKQSQPPQSTDILGVTKPSATRY